jgi:L-alanine-DL-glutamate epimerase-like enolase superfamily enzyme
MRITAVETDLLRLPIAVGGNPPTENYQLGGGLFVLTLQLATDGGLTGTGFVTSAGGGRALKSVVDDDLAPLVLNQDPIAHERLATMAAGRLQKLGPSGLVAQAYAAIDLALWDVKGKAAGLPLFRLLGGARESAPAYVGDVGRLDMNAEEIIDAARPYLDQNMMGIKVQVGAATPEADADRVARVREAVGEDAWLAVDAGGRYDYATALSMGHFFEEEMGIDWFEEPICPQDIGGHVRLADKLEVPLAVGASLMSTPEFQSYLERNAADVLLPQIGRLGGVTPWLRVAALAGLYHRPLAATIVPEVGVHLACGLPEVRAVEFVSILRPLFKETPAIVGGQLVPPRSPGLGLELCDDALEEFRVSA